MLRKTTKHRPVLLLTEIDRCADVQHSCDKYTRHLPTLLVTWARLQELALIAALLHLTDLYELLGKVFDEVITIITTLPVTTPPTLPVGYFGTWFGVFLTLMCRSDCSVANRHVGTLLGNRRRLASLYDDDSQLASQLRGWKDLSSMPMNLRRIAGHLLSAGSGVVRSEAAPKVTDI